MHGSRRHEQHLCYTELMILILHILIALASIVCSGYAFFSPSKSKLQVSYALTALTLISGTYLVISTHSPLLSSCVSGLVYLAIVIPLNAASSMKLSAAQSAGDSDK